MNLKITCRQAVDFISKKEENKLTSLQKVLLWKHLVVCSLCRAFSVQNKVITKAFTNHLHHNPYQLSEKQKEEMVVEIMQNDQNM